MRKEAADKIDGLLKSIRGVLAEDDEADMIHRRARGDKHNMDPVVEDGEDGEDDPAVENEDGEDEPAVELGP